MELPQFTYVRPPDLSGIDNALAGRRADETARQEAAVNQLKLQAWMQDRDYQMQQRHAAAANAANLKAKEADIRGIYSNFGITPAVIGTRGQAYSGTGVANDPYETIQNQFVAKGYLPQARDVVEYRNKMLTNQKTGAEITKLGEETKGILSENDKKVTEARAAQFKEYGDAILRAGSVPEVYALIDSHAKALTELGIPPEQAKKNFVDAYQKNGGDAKPNAFAQTLMQSSQGAMVTSKHLADIAQTEAQTFQANAAGLKSQGELEVAQQKQTWEQINPGYDLKETSQGWVAINKNNPNDVTLIKLGNEPAMPKPSGLTSDLAKLIQEQAALPDGSPLRQQYADAIAKLTGGVTPEKTEDAILATEDAVGQIDKLLKHPGFSEAVGASFGTSYISGTDAQGAIALHNQVTGTAFLNAYNSLRGTGSITEIEGQKATAAKVRMNRNTSEKDYIEAATEFKNILLRGIEREKARLKTGGTSPAPDATAKTETAPNTNSKGWALHTDAKGNKAYVSPDGKQFEEVK